VNAGFRSALFSHFYSSITYRSGVYGGDLVWVLKGYWLQQLQRYEDDFIDGEVWIRDLLATVVKKSRDTTVLDFYQYVGH
jgi:hypothetical protein